MIALAIAMGIVCFVGARYRMRYKVVEVQHVGETYPFVLTLRNRTLPWGEFKYRTVIFVAYPEVVAFWADTGEEIDILEDVYWVGRDVVNGIIWSKEYATETLENKRRAKEILESFRMGKETNNAGLPPVHPTDKEAKNGAEPT